LGAADASSVFLPGITVKDEHPNGCVDCHKNADKDYRLNVALTQIKGHPNIAKVVKKVPDGCAMCHKAGGSGKAPALANVVHEFHYKDAAKNAFVTYYQGACLNCHQLNVDNGEMKVKSGAANW
jgi:mono/diheme cytochrome c family protein